MIKTKSDEDEINLLEIFEIFFKGKIKIIFIIIISVICAIIIYKKQPVPLLVAEINIKPMGQNQLLQFDLVNSMDIYNIDQTILYNNYVSLLQERKVINNAIKKFNIISKEDYLNNQKYEEAVSIQSYKVAMSKNLKAKSFKITLLGKDQVELMRLIKYIKKENNKLAVQKYISNFNHKITLRKNIEEINKAKILNQINDAEIEFDVKTKKISQNLKFSIEDIDIKIKNSLTDYKIETDKKIKYLSEQALIARKLQISKLSRKAKSIMMNSSNGGVVAYLGAENNGPLYLMGYEAIEEEIRTIKKRENNELWAGNKELLAEKRELTQNKIIQRNEENKLFLDDVLLLKKDLRVIDRNLQTLLEYEAIFEEYLIKNEYDFESVNFEPYATKFKLGQTSSLSKILFKAITYGIIISFIYLLLEAKIFANRRKI